jgi:hypothetical protein
MTEESKKSSIFFIIALVVAISTILLVFIICIPLFQEYDVNIWIIKFIYFISVFFSINLTYCLIKFLCVHIRIIKRENQLKNKISKIIELEKKMRDKK